MSRTRCLAQQKQHILITNVQKALPGTLETSTFDYKCLESIAMHSENNKVWLDMFKKHCQAQQNQQI